MTELELLRKARAYMADHWTQGVDADGDGNVCARGAILKYDTDTFSSLRHSVLNQLDNVAKSLYPYRSIVYVNDEIGLEAVLRVYDTLIARLEEYEENTAKALEELFTQQTVYQDGDGTGNEQANQPEPELATV